MESLPESINRKNNREQERNIEGHNLPMSAAGVCRLRVGLGLSWRVGKYWWKLLVLAFSIGNSKGERVFCPLILFNQEETNAIWDLLTGISFPSYTEVLKAFKDRLTEHEQEEIMDYSKVWYLGLDAKKMEGSPSLPHNSGYDDESGGYLKVT